MRVLGIETSCDETSVAVVESDGVTTDVRSNLIYSQIAIHEPYGGIVPELAARKHIETLAAMVRQSLEKAGDSLDTIEGIAVTHGPGLIGSLLVGLNYAKALAWAREIPFVGVNHVEGHLNSIFLEHPKLADAPFMGLVVSGGHTSLIFVRAPGDYLRIGNTRDDAVGEAFDKAAKLLGLPYPGGPAIDKLAKQGDERAIAFPRAQVKKSPLDFSFSGLKTAVRLAVQDRGGLEALDEQTRADVAAGFQWAAVRALLLKARRAMEQYEVGDLAVIGGVAANSRLRAECEAFEREFGIHSYFPSLKYCTDNAAMIASLGARRLCAGERNALTLPATSRLPVGKAVEKAA